MMTGIIVREAYNTPMLMAISAPSFSRLRKLVCQIICQGRRARAISNVPENAVACVSVSIITHSDNDVPLAKV